ncbi:MAG: histidine kinase [Gemmatimonadota bacterium]|nr:MAG: histidine kinase [Gemmatimonadota bacterium]
MKTILAVTLFICCGVNVLFAHSELARVTFQVIAPTLDDSSVVYITGNHEKLGNWNPGAIRLKKMSADIWSFSSQFPKGFTLEFKFTKGSWEQEAVRENGEIPSNNYLDVIQDTTVSFVIKNWKDEFEYEIVGQITGTVVYHQDVKGHGLQARDIIVWLPPGYEKNETKRYPVFYMHDGQNLCDPRTSFIRCDWQIDEVADSLIRKGEIEPIIVVGMYNTSDRTPEYSPGPKGDAYMKFVVNVVKPLIDKTYRTLPDREHTAVGGSSMGGIVSFMLLWEYNDIFSKAACMSPAFKFDNVDYVTTVEKYKGPKKDMLVYIDNGGLGLEARLQPGIDDMIKMLEKKGYKENRDFYWFVDKTAEHNEAAWAKRIWKPLTLFFGR